eukprot:2730092-Rhodomonas_salina.1
MQHPVGHSIWRVQSGTDIAYGGSRLPRPASRHGSILYGPTRALQSLVLQSLVLIPRGARWDNAALAPRGAEGTQGFRYWIISRSPAKSNANAQNHIESARNLGQFAPTTAHTLTRTVDACP